MRVVSPKCKQRTISAPAAYPPVSQEVTFLVPGGSGPECPLWRHLVSALRRRSWFLVTVAVSVGCLSLASWQMGRRSERRTENAAAIAGRAQPVLELGATPFGTVLAQRRVVARGVFDHSAEVILRGHLLTGAPGVQVVTPLRLVGSDSAVLVNRGFVPAADGATPDFPVPAEPGEVGIEGIALAVPVTSDGGRPVTGAGGTSWRRLDLLALRTKLPYPVMDVYILAAPDSARRGWPRRIEAPPLGEGNHLSYALQWVGIAAAVFGFGLFFILGVGRGSVSAAPPAPPAPPPPRQR